MKNQFIFTLACMATATACHANVLSDKNRLLWDVYGRDMPVFVFASPLGQPSTPEPIALGMWAGSHHGGRGMLTVVGDGHFQVTGLGVSITNNQVHTWNATVDGSVELLVHCFKEGAGEVRMVYTNKNASGVKYPTSIKLRGLPPLSIAPKSSKAYIWCTAPDWVDVTHGDVFEAALTNQGFNVQWFRRMGGATLGDCTLDNYKAMANAGALAIISHGNAGEHGAVYRPLKTWGFNQCKAWIGNEQGMTIKSNLFYKTDGSLDEDTSYYYVAVDTTWVAANWKTKLDDNEAIVMWSSCYSASNCPTAGISVKEAAGGRWRSGYEGLVTTPEAVAVNTAFLGRMNGSIANGNFRTAGGAYNAINYKLINNTVKMNGNPWTTLCPAPLAVNPAYPLAPVTAKRKGWGGILFDTALSPVTTAAPLARIGGNAVIEDAKWLEDPEGNFYGFGFIFDKTLDNAPTTMKAFSNQIRNESGEGKEGRQMDGNRVQPNNDDFDWSF